jgi:hypothetical protein
MQRHRQSRFKHLKFPTLREIVAMDTYYGLVRDVLGWVYGQIYYGCTSHYINVYGMKAKSCVPKTYKAFLRDEGSPTKLHCDGAAEQKLADIGEINREYGLQESFSEQKNPWQNPVETRAIKWLGQAAMKRLDRTGAPDWLWLFALAYMALVNNWTADETLGWKTPHEKRHGYTPDISALLALRFLEKIYYLDADVSYPNSNEKAGYWLGVADNVGDCLTYYILTDDKHQVLARIVVRSATRSETNYRLQFDPIIESLVDKEYIERRTEQMGRGKKGKAATTNANDAQEGDVVARNTNVEADVVVCDANVEIMVNEKAQSAMSEDETGTDFGYEDDEANEGPVTTSFSIANSMEGERVDSLPGGIGQHQQRKISILA